MYNVEFPSEIRDRMRLAHANEVRKHKKRIEELEAEIEAMKEGKDNGD